MKYCNLCNDRGIVLENGVAKPCSCMKRRSLLKKIKNSHLTDKMREFTFNKFNFDYYSKKVENKETLMTYYGSASISYRAAKDFAKKCARGDSPDGLFITGNVGSGKTYLSCCIANYLLGKGRRVLFLVVPDFLDDIRATFGMAKSENYSEQELVDEARKMPVLILDDLGAHNYTEWTKNKIYSILNYRLNNDLPTVITTNTSLGNLNMFLGERTTSRISEMCRPCKLLVEVDIRILKRKEANK